MCHVDLYRIASSWELEDLCLEEVFSDQRVSIVEWAEKMMAPEIDGVSSPQFGIESWLEIRIPYLEDETRIIEITPHNFPSGTHPIFSLQ